MIDMVDRATLPSDTPWVDGVRTGPCIHCGQPASGESGYWPVHDATGYQGCRDDEMSRRAREEFAVAHPMSTE